MALTRDADPLFPELHSLLDRLPSDHPTNIPLVLGTNFTLLYGVSPQRN